MLGDISYHKATLQTEGKQSIHIHTSIHIVIRGEQSLRVEHRASEVKFSFLSFLLYNQLGNIFFRLNQPITDTENNSTMSGNCLLGNTASCTCKLVCHSQLHIDTETQPTFKLSREQIAQRRTEPKKITH